MSGVSPSPPGRQHYDPSVRKLSTNCDQTSVPSEAGGPLASRPAGADELGYCLNSIRGLAEKVHIQFRLGDGDKALSKDRVVFDTKDADRLIGRNGMSLNFFARYRTTVFFQFGSG